MNHLSPRHSPASVIYDREGNLSALQSALLLPLITPTVSALVQGRLLDGVKFFDTNSIRDEYPQPPTVKTTASAVLAQMPAGSATAHSCGNT